jgi:chloride channel protein, CIC family
MKSLYRKVFAGITYAKNSLSHKQFMFLSSIAVGLMVGLAVVVLKVFVHTIFITATRNNFVEGKYLFVFLPILGILLTVLVGKQLLKGKLEKGIGNIIYAIVKKSSIIPKEQTYSQIITSSLTVSLGGSAGLEAPSVITGAAFGSNYAELFEFNVRDKTLMLACGVAASIGAAFNAPIAGVLFTLEVLVLDISISAFTPLILAAATGALVSKIILQEGILLSFELKQPFDYNNVPYYFILGVLAGVVSVYYARLFSTVEKKLSHWNINRFQKALIGGALLSMLIFIFPTLFGEGYQSIKTLSFLKPENLLEGSILQAYKTNEWFVLAFVGIAMLIKPLASALTLGSGGNGGNFAPSLFVGAYLGFFFARLLNFLRISQLPESNFCIVGMAGILSGIYHAPLTAIFLIAEITGGYTLIIPLMIVSSIGYAISKYLEPYSMDTQKLVQKGALYTHDRDHNILTTLKTSDLIETDFQKINPKITFDELVRLIAVSKRNIFPVVNAEEKLLGIILLDNIKTLVFQKKSNKNMRIQDIMIQPPTTVALDESMESAMEKFDKTQVWNLPVIDNGKYVGFISKSGILSLYRNQLKDLTII